MTVAAIRVAVADAARAMSARGLTTGTSGNVSARTPQGMVVTPSALPYATMRAEDTVHMGLDGSVIEGRRKPTTESHLHAAIYLARPEVGSIVHTHSTFCTTLSTHRKGIPPFHYMIGVAGGTDIRCADYATFGTPELAAHAVAALEGRAACLLANHGMVALGETPATTIELAAEVETLAELYWRALQIGEPVLLTEEEMADALRGFADYRPHPEDAP